MFAESVTSLVTCDCRRFGLRVATLVTPSCCISVVVTPRPRTGPSLVAFGKNSSVRPGSCGLSASVLTGGCGGQVTATGCEQPLSQTSKKAGTNPTRIVLGPPPFNADNGSAA